MLHIIGLGLGDERDITVKGLDAIKSSARVYLEAYTSILGVVSQAKLEAFYGKSLIIADRDMVETDSDAILEDAQNVDVSFLVVGDPFGATTHADLVLRAEELKVPVNIIHNASIMNAVGANGLALYNYGQTVSIPFFTETWRPSSWLERIMENWRLGLHTLCLLDIKVKEQSEENLARGRKIYEPARFMSTLTAINQLLSLDTAELDPTKTLAISIASLGSEDQVHLAGTLSTLSQCSEEQFGKPLHSFVIVGKRFHPMERDFAKRFAVDQQEWAKVAEEVYGCKG